MNRIILPFFAFILLASSLFAAAPARDIGGSISLAVASVDQVICYSNAEKNAEILKNPSGVVTNFTPSFYETAISTTIKPFKGLDEFNTLLNSKTAVIDKGLELEKDLLAYQDLLIRYPAFSAAITNRINKLKAQIDLLVSLFNSL